MKLGGTQKKVVSVCINCATSKNQKAPDCFIITVLFNPFLNNKWSQETCLLNVMI